MELAVDTSTGLASIALAHRGRVLAEHTWRADFSHTRQLMPAIESMLAQAGLKPSGLHAITVATGPGSFSGLRVGLSAAKGLALALGVPLIGVGTLLVEAYPFFGAGLPVRPLLDAGRGEVSSAVFPKDAALREPPPTLSSLRAIIDATTERTLFCGEHLPSVRGELRTLLGELACFPPDSALARRAGNLAELAWHRLLQGEAGDAASVQPLYLRGPSITKPAGEASAVRR
jgi:tRNA threonylcarbamoyladenosine biosynthesis protein TsaB